MRRVDPVRVAIAAVVSAAVAAATVATGWLPVEVAGPLAGVYTLAVAKREGSR